MVSYRNGQAVSTSANTDLPATQRMSAAGSSASAASPAATASAAASAAVVNPDKAIARLLYAMLKQKSLKDIDWNQVASDPVLLEKISNGHAARMRYSRFRNAVENSKSTKRQSKNADSKASPSSASLLSRNKVTKRRSAGVRKIQKDGDGHDDGRKDAGGDTEEDPDCTGKENRHRRHNGLDRSVTDKGSCGQDTWSCPRAAAKPPKEDPDVVNPQTSFSSLPSPPMELEHTVEYMDESPLVDLEPLLASAAPSAAALCVPKTRKAAMHSPSMETTLHQIPQAYGVPNMGVGLGLPSSATRIHSMPLLHTYQQQHQQDFPSMPNIHGTGGTLMMRHHSAGSLAGLAGSDADKARLAASSTGPLLGQLRTRLLTPSSDDYHHHHQQQQQQQQHAFYHGHPQPLLQATVDDILALSAPFSSASHPANASTSNDMAATPHTQHTQWTGTPFASPPLGDTLDSTLDSLDPLNMSPYVAAGMDFAVAGDSGMDPVVHPSTSLFALADDGRQPQNQPENQPQSQQPQQQPYMSHAFAKHSSGWDAMISQGIDHI